MYTRGFDTGCGAPHNGAASRDLYTRANTPHLAELYEAEQLLAQEWRRQSRHRWQRLTRGLALAVADSLINAGTRLRARVLGPSAQVKSTRIYSSISRN